MKNDKLQFLLALAIVAVMALSLGWQAFRAWERHEADAAIIELAKEKK